MHSQVSSASETNTTGMPEHLRQLLTSKQEAEYKKRFGAYQKGLETKAKKAAAARKAAVATAKAWSEGEKEAALWELLDEKKLADAALETLLKGWVGALGGKNPSRLSWVRDYFGTPFYREGEKRFRQASLSSVLARLVKFCLSAADRDTTSGADLGLFELTADPKTAEALLKLSEAGEGVVLTTSQYNGLMQLARLLKEQGQEFVLPDGKSVKAYVEEVLPGGFEGFAKEQEKAAKTRK